MASPTRPPPPPPPLSAPDDEPNAPDVEREDETAPTAAVRGPAIPSAIDVSHVGERRVIRRAEVPHPAPDPDHLDIIDED